MKKHVFLFLFGMGSIITNAQLAADKISTDFVLQQRRISFDKNMREKIIEASFQLKPDSSNEDKFREACWAISQFLFRSNTIESGFRKMFAVYASLETGTRRALLEAVYGVYPTEFREEINKLLQKESDPRLFAMQAVYLYRIDSSIRQKEALLRLRSQLFPDHAVNLILAELENYFEKQAAFMTKPPPDLISLFLNQKKLGVKIVYSFQRWNRDYPGMAIVQNADGSFVKNADGTVASFQQLARSASNLPYFITNGSTPQGIYSIQGTAVSHNNFIGPTPNLQLIMPNETDSLYWHTVYDSSKTELDNYLQLLPKNWKDYEPMREVFMAGKIGRTEIIAHGSTIDPAYFKGKPFYPLTPTMGCLCAKELWDIYSGKFLESHQFGLANSFLATPDNKGYLLVINLDNQPKAVEKEELKKIVEAFEKTNYASIR